MNANRSEAAQEVRFPSTLADASSDWTLVMRAPKVSKLTFLRFRGSSFKLCPFRESHDANFFQMCIKSLYGKELTHSTLCCKSAKFGEFLTNANCFFSLPQVFYVYFITLHLEIIPSMLNDDSSSAHSHPKRRTKPNDSVLEDNFIHSFTEWARCVAAE